MSGRVLAFPGGWQPSADQAREHWRRRLEIARAQLRLQSAIYLEVLRRLDEAKAEVRRVEATARAVGAIEDSPAQGAVTSDAPGSPTRSEGDPT